MRPNVVNRNWHGKVLIDCPYCGTRGMIDEDQYHGRISIDCDNCNYHETHNIAFHHEQKHQ